jgi:large subunit ribosomal protein L18
MDKKQARIRRAVKTRAKAKQLNSVRLCVNRTPRHIYAQLIDTEGKIIATAATVEKEIKSAVKYTGNSAAASEVGKQIAARGKKAGVTKVSFDRSGFKYHGRVKALADAAREDGLEF